MKGRKVPRHVPLSPMQIGQRENERIAAAFVAAEASGVEDDRAEAVHMREQLALHASYVDACAKLEKAGDAMRTCANDLVKLRFPMRLTQRTRASVEDGMYRAFTHFLQDLHSTVCDQQGGVLADEVTNVDTFLAKLANVLTLESCRVLDGLVTNNDACAVCTSYIEKCRTIVVRAECEQVLGLAESCRVVLDLLATFGMKAADMHRAVPARMRAFLRAAERKGMSAAAQRLAREPQLQPAMAKHGWLLGGEFDDAKLVRIYELLLLTHTELAQTLTWQRRRVAWLAAANPAHRCWCGVAVATGMSGALVHAPAHMRRFAGQERVRVVLETQEVPFSCYLSTVGVANVVLELLHARHLPLNRIDAAYANRILTFDFCKYESAARNILEDTVRPWCERMHPSQVH
jgi:hypothetical protein